MAKSSKEIDIQLLPQQDVTQDSDAREASDDKIANEPPLNNSRLNIGNGTSIISLKVG
jgi:hypothetical protein